MASERTKSLKHKRNIFGIISVVLWIGTVLFLAIYAFATKEPAAPKEGIQILSNEAKDWLFGLGITACIGIIGALVIKERIRTFIWMLSLIMAVIEFGQAGMFTVLSLWLVDEYFVSAMFTHYCHLVQINKEIDFRS